MKIMYLHCLILSFRVVEFRTKELCAKAVEVMNQHEIRDRKIVVKEVSMVLFVSWSDTVCLVFLLGKLG